MGWDSGRFPVFSQLNIITSPAHIEDTYKFFTETYGPDGDTYTVGCLARDWRPNGNGTPEPPWQHDEDNPWKEGDANEWFAHCQEALKQVNQGLDHDGTMAEGTVEEVLRRWIIHAITKKEQIVYRYRRDQTADAGWQADRKQASGRWYITVTGPGFPGKQSAD